MGSREGGCTEGMGGAVALSERSQPIRGQKENEQGPRVTPHRPGPAGSHRHGQDTPPSGTHALQMSRTTHRISARGTAEVTQSVFFHRSGLELGVNNSKLTGRSPDSEN